MILTTTWLNENEACHEGRDWFTSQKETDCTKVLKKLGRLTMELTHDH